MSPDKVCEEYAQKGVKIKVEIIDDMVLFEGKPDALEFLGKLFLAQAKFQKDDGFQISPSGAGKLLFNSKSTHGLYLRRV